MEFSSKFHKFFLFYPLGPSYVHSLVQFSRFPRTRLLHLVHNPKVIFKVSPKIISIISSFKNELLYTKFMFYILYNVFWCKGKRVKGKSYNPLCSWEIQKKKKKFVKIPHIFQTQSIQQNTRKFLIEIWQKLLHKVLCFAAIAQHAIDVSLFR